MKSNKLVETIEKRYPSENSSKYDTSKVVFDMQREKGHFTKTSDDVSIQIKKYYRKKSLEVQRLGYAA